MNPNLQRFIAENKAIAHAKSVAWDLSTDIEGRIGKDEAWNLTRMSGGSPPPTSWLRDLGTDAGTIEVLSSVAAKGPEKTYKKQPLSGHWQDLIKASVIDQLFVRQNTATHVLQNIVRPLRVLGTCASSGYPWKLTADDLTLAFDTAKQMQSSGKLADLIFGVVRSLLDPNHLTDNGPLSPTLTQKIDQRGSKIAKSVRDLRKNLEDRKNAEKLPDQRAFWELTRIVFTETPRTFLDSLRFAQVKVLLLTGLRIGEVAIIPADWKRYRDFYDRKGRPAGELGGYSRSLMLRHFAEKQRNMNELNMVLFESMQHIPPMFEHILTETLDEVARLTAPLRDTLKRQIETCRLLPQFKQSDLVRAVELYTFLTGNPFFVDINDEVRQRFKEEYEKSYDPSVFDKIRSLQLQAMHFGQRTRIGTSRVRKASQSYHRRVIGSGGIGNSTHVYFGRLKGVPFRRDDGSVWEGKKQWNSVYLNVGEIERYYSETLSTKLSDVTSLKLADGELAPWELMFLMPKRALAEGFGNGLCDVTRHCAIGRVDSSLMIDCLSNGRQTLFSEYGQTDEDRALTLNSHSLRHLQNTELLRLGVADTIITKRFNRRSVAQSYDYDHRSLSEELSRIELSPEIEERLGEKSSMVLKMIKLGRANGPIVNEFKRIQKKHGEDAALDFLRVEADGFHPTPWGTCINSFTVDPCPKHLECFSGCRHLSATDLPENRHNLVQLERRLEAAVRSIEARESDSVGRKNQLDHGMVRLEAVRKILATPAGKQVFPDGPDLSILKSAGGVLDGIE